MFFPVGPLAFRGCFDYSPSGNIFPQWSFGALVVARENSEWGIVEVIIPGLCGSQYSHAVTL